MAKTKRQYILATCFLSGAAAIISFVALGTQEWITSNLKSDSNDTHHHYMAYGLFSGVFDQAVPVNTTFYLTTVCAWDLNICAQLCGDNAEDNLRKIYNGESVNPVCSGSNAIKSSVYRRISPRKSTTKHVFINTGAWFCTILFLIISGVMGLFSAGLAIWNTVTNPYQVYLSIFGLYIYKGIAFCSILLSVVLWGAMFAQDLQYAMPTYKVYNDEFILEGNAQLGYSYWMNLASLFLYLFSISLLYIRNYLISREPEVNLQLEDSTDPVIYLY